MSAGRTPPTARFGATPPSARLGRLGLLHPFPSVLVALSTGALALLAGASSDQAALAAVGMAGFQASIGALNDLADRETDAVGQPWKPIPSGVVGVATARLAAAVGLAVGAAASAVLGPATLAVGLAGFGLGVLYDLWAKRTGWGWLCLALALPLVPVYAWQAAEAGLPPRTAWLFVLGVVAGLELAIANGLVDVATDAALEPRHGRGIVLRLGVDRARVVMVAAGLGLLSVAWATLLTTAGRAALPMARPGELVGPAALLVSSALVVLGLAASARTGGPGTGLGAWRGWHLQAVGVAATAIIWLVAVA